jgi:hypothetical protein
MRPRVSANILARAITQVELSCNDALPPGVWRSCLLVWTIAHGVGSIVIVMVGVLLGGCVTNVAGMPCRRVLPWGGRSQDGEDYRRRGVEARTQRRLSWLAGRTETTSCHRS